MLGHRFLAEGPVYSGSYQLDPALLAVQSRIT